MMWQDLVFLVGSMTSVVFLIPTLWDAAARVPRATSIPSMLIGGVYSLTFFTMGMEFSAIGAFSTCTIWSLIALLRAPDDRSLFEDTPIPPASEWRTLLAARLHGDDATHARSAGVEDNFDGVSNSD